MNLFRQIFHRRKMTADLSEEMRQHLDEKIEALVAEGMPREEAIHAARRAFGNATLLEQRSREIWMWPFLESLWADVKFALRQLRKSPGFTITAILTLALGIGANTAIFSVVNAVLRHPAGVDHPERIAVLNTRYTKYSLNIPYVSVPVYALAASLKAHVEAAAIESPASFNILHNGIPEHVSAARVSWQWFRVFGAIPILGRTFAPEEDQPNAGPVAVLSYGLWQSTFGGQRDVIGQTVLLDNTPYRIIGVMRSDFAWPRGYQIWVPIALAPAAFAPNQGFNENYQAMLRLRPGISVQQFNAEISTKMWGELRRLGGSSYATRSGWSVYSTPLTDSAAGPLRTPLYVLLGVVVLVLLIAAANVAGLILARASARSQEFAIRTALGASVGRMMQQLLIEMLLLAGFSAGLGIVLGPTLGKLLLLMIPHNLAAGYTVRMEPAMLAFTAGAALLVSLIAGLGPAFKIMQQRRRLGMNGSERSATASGGKQRLRSAFVIGEVALAYLLLAGTGLFLVSLQKLQHIDPGFNPHHVLAGRVYYVGADFKNNQQRQAAFVRDVVDTLATKPGVRSAAAVEPLPFDPDTSESNSFDIEGRPKSTTDPGPHSHLTYTTPGYLKVMQIPLLAGRWFTDADRRDTPRVIVIDARLAHKYWPNQNPIGQHLDSGPANSWATVVGVVSNIRSDSLEEDTTDGMRYYPFAQVNDTMANFLARTDGDANGMTVSLKQSVASVDPSQAVSTTVSMETLISDSLAGRRLIIWMLATFAGLALLLAAIGIYGLISYVTAQRTNEIGIRMALGAHRIGIVHLVMASALRRVIAGLVIGITMSVAVTGLFRHLFAVFGGGAFWSLAVAAATLMIVGGLAGFIPAIRAASIDPMQALRAE